MHSLVCTGLKAVYASPPQPVCFVTFNWKQHINHKIQKRSCLTILTGPVATEVLHAESLGLKSHHHMHNPITKSITKLIKQFIGSQYKKFLKIQTFEMQEKKICWQEMKF
jgi:hypothetical protein